MAKQERFIIEPTVFEQDIEVTGTSTFLDKLVINGLTLETNPTLNFGPGIITDEVVLSFSTLDYDSAAVTLSVVNESDSELYTASFSVGSNGVTSLLSSLYGVVDLWGLDKPVLTTALVGNLVEVYLSINKEVSVEVVLDARLYTT
jgi:hypothetical protein